jgi:hypothetical protein
MLKRKSKNIVIDTSIASSAGGPDAKKPQSTSCRDFLIAVKDICHKIVWTPEISSEWKKHRSNFAQTWLTQMAGKKKIIYCNNVENEELRNRVAETGLSEKKIEAMLKDILLIEAALVTDKIVTARDDTVRELFRGISNKVGELKDIVWVNPCNEDEQVIEWLEAGARSDKQITL